MVVVAPRLLAEVRVAARATAATAGEARAGAAARRGWGLQEQPQAMEAEPKVGVAGGGAQGAGVEGGGDLLYCMYMSKSVECMYMWPASNPGLNVKVSRVSKIFDCVVAAQLGPHSSRRATQARSPILELLSPI